MAQGPLSRPSSGRFGRNRRGLTATRGQRLLTATRFEESIALSLPHPLLTGTHGRSRPSSRPLLTANHGHAKNHSFGKILKQVFGAFGALQNTFLRSPCQLGGRRGGSRQRSLCRLGFSWWGQATVPTVSALF